MRRRKFLDAPPVHNPEIPGMAQGTALSMCDSDYYDAVFSGRGKQDLKRSWTRNQHIRLRENDNIFLDFEVTIDNLGNSTSELAQLWLILWGTGQRAFVVRHPGNISIDMHSSYTVEKVIVPFPAGPFLTSAEVTHVYALVFDPLMDPLSSEEYQFLDDSKAGRAVISQNLCRVSRRVGCWTPGDHAFKVSGNQISHTMDGLVEVAYVSRDALNDFGFALYYPRKEFWHPDLPSTSRGLLGTHAVPAGELSFALLTNGGEGFLSTDAAHCRMDDNESDVVFLEWEDGSDADYNDYVFRLIHR